MHKVNGSSSVVIVVTFDLLSLVSYIFDVRDANLTLRKKECKDITSQRICKYNNNKNGFIMRIDALYIAYINSKG